MEDVKGPENDFRLDGKIVGGRAFVGRRPMAQSRSAALVRIAQETDPHLALTAKTMPEHGPSTRILASLEFLQAGTVSDHEIEDAWYWEKRPEQSS